MSVLRNGYDCCYENVTRYMSENPCHDRSLGMLPIDKTLDSEKFLHTISNKKCKKTLDKDAIMCGRIGSIEHYAKEGLEEFTSSVEEDEEGNAEAAFTTDSFSLFELLDSASMLRMETMVGVSAPNYVSKDTRLTDCGVPGCNGKCNIKWTVCSDGTAKIAHDQDLVQNAKSYHIHVIVYMNDTPYQVTDIQMIINSHGHLFDDLNRPLEGKKVEIDDSLAAKMVGNSSFSFPVIEEPPSDKVLEQLGYTVTETPIKDGYGVSYSTETAEDGTPTVITITNIEGVELPSTGGTGTYLYTIGGSAILAGGLLYGLQLRRRREGTAE